ncbi:AT-rich interactive domain-containing protein 2-like [Asterias rubens]|uniref:AT-rich interactive domain-containing protein 2-like n=1 Tax=Asterias rubens TaxID=7604 RepID=UPI0014557439|nr:AT-rich interactive domain-containing protein 2-like [Asterias rubens]
MAKFLDKDPYIYEQERYAFTNQLRQFHATKGTPFFRLPTIAGKTLDLYLLYSKVIAWGGLAKVTEQGKWETLQEYFGIPATCGHAIYALRQFYVKYLESYERIHHQGEDAEEVLRSRSRLATPSSVPQKRNMDTRRGREISDLVRSNAGLCTKKPRISEYDKIMFSLQSGLPNEVDFAINVCTLLSNEGRHVLHLERAVKLIDLLLAHCGVFYEGAGGYRSLYQEDWKPTTERDFVTFWYDTVTDNDIREIIGPDTLRTKGHCKVKDADMFTVRQMGLNDIEGQRILQVAVILRNLSFEDHNKKVMAAHRTFYRFLLLCIHNSCSALQQLGMDTLSNIAEEFILDPIDYRSTQLMFHTIDKAMKNQDKFIILRAMEVVEKLSQVDSNMAIIRQCMEERVYRSIISLLTIHDVQLLLGALEVLLALSHRGEIFCTRIATIEKSVDVLVCLVTLDAQSLGADAFLGIKIVDHAPDGVHHPIVTMARYQPVSQTPPPSNAAAHTPPHQVSRPVQPPTTPSPAPAAVQNPQINRDTENEKFTCQWLHSFYEADSEGSVSRLDLYSDYLSACSKASRVNIVTSTNFATCIKMVFQAAGFQRAETETGPQLFITGMRKRILPLPFNWQMYRQSLQASPNYQPQLGGPQSNLASSIMQRMAQRLSPSPSGSSTAGTSQQWLLNQGVASPGSSPMLPMYRPGMMPGGSGTNAGSSTQLQQLILGHRQQSPGASQGTTQPQSSNQVDVGVAPGFQVNQQQMQQQQQQQVLISPMSFPKGMQQQQVPNAKPVPTNCPPNMVQGVPDKASSADDSDMLSPQGSLVNQAGVPNAFLQNPLPQHSQTIANNDPSKSPGRSPSSPCRAPPPYRPRSPAGSGSKSSVPTSSVLNSETTISTASKIPSPAVTVATEVLQEGEVKIEKIPNIHAQLPLDTNQVPTTFPQQESENFTTNSIPLLQTKTPENSDLASAQTNHPVVYNANQQALPQAHQPAVVNNSVDMSPGQQALNIPQQQLYIAQQQLQSAKGMHINPSGIQLSAQGIQIAPQRHQQQGNNTQGIQVQMPAGQVKQWVQPQGSQPNAQGATLNTGATGIVATNGFKGCQPNIHLVQQGVLSGTQGIQLVHQNSLPVQTTLSNFHIKQPDGQGVSQIISQPAQTQQQQFIVSNCAGPTKNGSQVYSAYAVVQNIQRNVPNVLGQVAPGNPGQAAQGGVQPPTGSTATYIPIQPKLTGQQQQQVVQQQHVVQQQNVVQQQRVVQQQQQYAVQQQHVVQQQQHTVQQQQHAVQQQCHFVSQQQPVQQQQQQQPQYILTSVQGTLPQQSYAVSTIANAQQQQQQQATFTVNVGTSATYPAVQSAVKLCPQYTTSQSNQSGNTVTVNHAQHQNQPHIDSPLIKQLLQSGSAVQPPSANHLPQTQVSNPNMQNAVQWVVPQNPSGGVMPSYDNSVQGLVNIQGAIGQPIMPQAFAVNPTYTQLGQSTNQQTAMHFIPPLSASPSPTASPALSCSSSSSPSSTSKSGTLSPLHKSEKKSKSKSHKSKKSSKKKKSKSKSGTRSPPNLCSKSKHIKDISDEQEKEESIQMVENSSLDKDNADHAQDNSNTCNNKGSLELTTQKLTNRIGVTDVNDCTPKPTCNGSATNDITQSYEIQKLKSKLDEASLKLPLLNGYGSGDELDKKQKDVVIHRAELLLENSGMELDRDLKIQREIDDVGLTDRTCNLNHGAESVDKQCSNNVMNGDIPEKLKNNSESDVDSLLHSRDKHGIDGESVRVFAKDDAKLSEECEESQEAAVNNEINKEEPMDQSDSKRDRDSESDSGIVLNERTGFMYDVSGTIIARESNLNVPTTANNLSNNSNPQLPVISDKGSLANNLPHEVLMEGTMCSQKPKSPLESTVQPTSGLNSQSNESVHNDGQTAGVEMNSQNSDQTSQSQTGNSLPVSQEKVQVKHKPSETKSEKSSSSKSKKSSSDSKHSSGKHSRHSSDSSSSKKRRRSSSSSSSSHHRKSSSSSSDKSKHHHHHHQQQQQQQQQEHQQQSEADICICDWSGCRRSFKTRKSLHVHTSTAHVMIPTYRGLCEWENCDNIQRQRWSCVSHILDKHCTEQALRAAAERRQGTSTPSSTSASGTLPTPILYNAHTAYHAIRRSLHTPSLKDLLGESEGPVTKSIHITAALVLKNMATYSADARSLLRRHEVHLAKLAISNAEASSTLAKCVGELNDERHLEYDDLSDDSSDS